MMSLPRQLGLISTVILLSITTPGYTEEGPHCRGDDSVFVKALTGKDVLENGEIISWESRVEKTSDDIRRFVYCVVNQRKYRPITVRWSDGAEGTHFQGAVPPLQKRDTSRDSTVLEFSASVKLLAIDDRQHDAETLAVQLQKANIQKTTTLRSQATVDVPAHPGIAAMIAKNEYPEWKASDFLTLQIDFNSTAEPPDNTGQIKITNQFKISVSGDEKAQVSLKEHPLLVQPVLTSSSLEDFWGPAHTDVVIDKFTEIEQTGNPWIFSKETPVYEHQATIGVSNKDAPPYASFQVSYFGR
jgi:hypothetical protein